MSLWNKLVGWGFKTNLAHIEKFIQNPFQTQAQVLVHLLKMAKDTAWGKEFNYAQIHNYEMYKKEVPISSYEQLFPYIDKMMHGEENILWPTPIQWFSKSSGTTNARSKFIPVSKESLEACHFQAGKDLVALYIKNNPHTKLFAGKALSLGGTFQRNPAKKEIFYGDVSAVVVENLPKWVQLFRTPPLEVAMLEKWEEKIEKMVEITLKQNITSILGVPTWTIVLLERILAITGKKNIKEVWPNFEVFFHGAVAFQPYRNLFNQLAPGINYQETYNASEGFFAMQDDLQRDDMLLMLDYGIFYEFIPLEEADKEHPRTYILEEVELYKNYVIVVSTNGGLWRYKIGDTVKFTSKDPYRIKITGRTKNFINAFGEEVIIENAEIAITTACQQTEAIVTEFTAGPIYMEENTKGGHEWIIEFSKPPVHKEQFVKILDETLREINSDYDAKRYKDLALQMPIIHIVPEGTFYNWMKKRGKLGGQYKVPRLANSRDYLEDILSMLATA